MQKTAQAAQSARLRFGSVSTLTHVTNHMVDGTWPDADDAPVLNRRYPTAEHPAQFLRLAQADSSLTKKELARRAEIATSTLSNYFLMGEVRARIPQAHDLRRIANVLAADLGVDKETFWTELGQLLDNLPPDKDKS